MTKESRPSGFAKPYSSRFDEQWEQIAEDKIPGQPTISIGAAPVVPTAARAREPRQRRRGTRFPAHLPAMLLTADHHTAVHCSAVDVSLSGALLSMPERSLSRREPLRLCLALPRGILNVGARPVRSNDHEHAFEFIDLAADDRSQLARYIHDSFGPTKGSTNWPALWRLR